MATATPSARRGPRRRRSSTPGRSSRTRSHPPPASVLPDSAARKVSALAWQAHIPGTCAAPGPGSATWKDADPRRRSSRGSGGSESACLPGDGGYATPAACLRKRFRVLSRASVTIAGPGRTACGAHRGQCDPGGAGPGPGHNGGQRRTSACRRRWRPRRRPCPGSPAAP